MLTTAPVIAPMPDQVFGAGQVFREQDFAQFTQQSDSFPDTMQYTYNIQWGDGVSPDTGGTLPTTSYHAADTAGGQAFGFIGVNPAGPGSQQAFDTPGVYTVTVTVTNSDNLSDTKSFTATVLPMPTMPTDHPLTFDTDITPDGSGQDHVTEGTPLTLNLHSAGFEHGPISSWTINWGDSIETINGDPSSVQHTYTTILGDPTGFLSAQYQIRAWADTNKGQVAADSAIDVAVDDVPPTVTVTPDPFTSVNPDGSYNVNVNEGQTLTLHLSQSDPGTEPPLKWVILWGDEDPNNQIAEQLPGDATTATHVYADGDSQGLTVYSVLSAFANGTDLNGGFGLGNAVTVTVHNVAPTGDLSTGGPVDEGATSASVGFSNQFDPGTADTAAGFHYAYDFNNDGIWDVGDGTYPGSMPNASAAVPASFLNDGPGTFTIKARIIDKDGGATDYTTQLVVNNVAPTATLSGGGTVNEGASGSVSFSNQFDPSTADTAAGFHYAYDFNNDGIWDVGDGTYAGSGTSASAAVPASFVNDGPGTFTIKARIIDKDGGATDYTTQLVVNNVAPTATLSNDGPVNEGSVAHVSFGGQSDPSPIDTAAGFHYAYDFNNDGIWDVGNGTYAGSGTSASAAVPSNLTADGPASFTAKARIIDKDGGFTDYTTTIVVKNVAPTANAGGPYTTFDDTPITLTATATDPAGPLDPLTFAWDLDNNGTYETSGASATFNPVTLGLTGTQTRTVGLRVSDGDGGVATVTTTVQILGQGVTLANGTLYVVGSSSASSGDIINVTMVGNKIQVFSNVTNYTNQLFNVSDVHALQIVARGGNDTINVASNVTVPAIIDGGDGNDVINCGGGPTVAFGGAGNDVIVGGAGGNILVGGDGNDVVVGGSARDVLIGGKGSDVISGNAGDDILIGGYTSYDSNVTALDQVMAIWNSSASFADRVAALTGANGLLRANVTVFDDHAQDVLSGDDGHDLYFADTSNSDGVVDVTGLQAALDALVAVN
jgi:hypothetical protein